MEMDAIVSIISTVGFPIVCCLILMWFCKYLIDGNKQTIEKISADQNDSLDKITEALNSNTAVMKEVLLKLDLLSRKE